MTETDISGLPITKLEGHADQRYENVRTVFATLCALRASEILPPGTVTLKGAEFQKETGSIDLGTQAAHTLPRQLLIGGQSIDTWLRHSTARDAEYIKFIRLGVTGVEGTVTVLAKAVNQADSLWERSGLAEAFRASAERIVHRKPHDVTEACSVLVGSWRHFHTEAGQALQRAIPVADATTNPILQVYALTHPLQASDWGQGTIGMTWSIIVEKK